MWEHSLFPAFFCSLHINKVHCVVRSESKENEMVSQYVQYTCVYIHKKFIVREVPSKKYWPNFSTESSQLSH